MNFLEKLHRLELTDNAHDAIIKLAEGNPGALSALTSMVMLMQRVDPTNPLGVAFPIFAFDALEIYGTAIYVLWSDVCRKDSSVTIAVLRAVELDLITPEEVKKSASVQGFSGRLPLEEIVDAVQEKVPHFKIV